MNDHRIRTPLPTDFSALAETIAETPDTDAMFAAVARIAGANIGHRLFTVMAFDAAAMTVQRAYSDNPEAYPPGGIKNKRDTAWGRLVLDDGQPFIGRDADAIRAHFDDHQVIFELGLESVLNVPIRLGGQTLGTMNLLHDAGFYDEADLPWGFFLAGQLAAPLAHGAAIGK